MLHDKLLTEDVSKMGDATDTGTSGKGRQSKGPEVYEINTNNEHQMELNARERSYTISRKAFWDLLRAGGKSAQRRRSIYTI